MQFQKHYTLDEARSLLPSIREWLSQVQQLQRRIKNADDRIGQMLEGGNDAGGSNVNEMVRTIGRLNDVMHQFRSRDIQVKDVDRGLLDFPSILNGREVFLCWEQDEEDIEFWHDLDTGYAGREKL